MTNIYHINGGIPNLLDELDGSYDKLSLPEDFPELVERVWDFICLYGWVNFSMSMLMVGKSAASRISFSVR